MKKSLVVLNDCMFSEKQIAYLKSHFKDVQIYHDTNSEQLAIKRIGNKNIVIMDQFMFTFGEDLLKRCNKLELIIVNTTAHDQIDTNLLNKYKIKLANLRDYATQDVAETGIGMVLALNNKIEIAQNAAAGKNIGYKNYAPNKVSDIWPGHPVIPFLKRKTLKGQTIGIIGLGNIGQRSAELAHGLGMRVLGFNRTRKYVPYVDIVPLRKLFIESDIIYIALTYNPLKNKHFINKNYLQLAKKDSLFVSVCHPDLVDMDYLLKHHDKFRGIGLDYLITDEVRELIKVRTTNIIVTPHLGSQSETAYSNLTETIIEIAESFSEGKPLYLVN